MTISEFPLASQGHEKSNNGIISVISFSSLMMIKNDFSFKTRHLSSEVVEMCPSVFETAQNNGDGSVLQNIRIFLLDANLAEEQRLGIF